MTLYRQLPECDGCRYTEGACISAIRNGSIKCCPDCKHREPVTVDYDGAAEYAQRVFRNNLVEANPEWVALLSRWIIDKALGK